MSAGCFPALLPERRANKMDHIPIIDLAATGKNIRDLRVSAGVSVKDLQGVLGFANPQAIYKWQRGFGLPSIDNLVIIAAELGVKIDDILVIQQ